MTLNGFVEHKPDSRVWWRLICGACYKRWYSMYEVEHKELNYEEDGRCEICGGSGPDFMVKINSVKEK